MPLIKFVRNLMLSRPLIRNQVQKWYGCTPRIKISTIPIGIYWYLSVNGRPVCISDSFIWSDPTQSTPPDKLTIVGLLDGDLTSITSVSLSCNTGMRPLFFHVSIKILTAMTAVFFISLWGGALKHRWGAWLYIYEGWCNALMKVLGDHWIWTFRSPNVCDHSTH